METSNMQSKPSFRAVWTICVQSAVNVWPLTNQRNEYEHKQSAAEQEYIQQKEAWVQKVGTPTVVMH